MFEFTKEETQKIVIEKLSRRLQVAKTALAAVEIEYDSRKGFISVDTIRDVHRALEIIQ